jgi:hypothetical protein
MPLAEMMMAGVRKAFSRRDSASLVTKCAAPNTSWDSPGVRRWPPTWRS